MKLLIIFVCLLSVSLGTQILYTPGYSYYTAPGLAFARSGGSVLPLAYSRLISPGGESHVFHSVETPNSYQQQYRSDYKPLTYEYLI